ncbi:MAG TPA: hypothetical protein VJ992_02250 [Gemmatimonadales bacterium]|nr:hypothetical protein [Gemmatimonadales bacterium]
MAPDALPDTLAVALDMARLFDRLGIPYVAAGSLASSFHGEPRSTNDVDFVVDMQRAHVERLVTALGDRYYVSAETVAEAVQSGGTFNVIHLASAVKVDCFVVGNDPFDAERVARGTPQRVGASAEETLRIDTAEDTVLRKLEWYRRGDEVSEHQWRDVVAIMRGQGPQLDWDRLRAWAPRLGVADLLERARQEGMGR